jgi:hypothetical protein
MLNYQEGQLSGQPTPLLCHAMHCHATLHSDFVGCELPYDQQQSSTFVCRDMDALEGIPGLPVSPQLAPGETKVPEYLELSFFAAFPNRIPDAVIEIPLLAEMVYASPSIAWSAQDFGFEEYGKMH